MANTSYVLRDDTRVYFHDENEIRFRKGVWNYVEAIVSLREQPEKVRSFFFSVVERLLKEESVDTAALAAHAELSAEEAGEFGKIFDEISRQGYLCSVEEGQVRRTLSAILGGSFGSLAQYAQRAAPVMFLTDDPSGKDLASTTAKQMGMPMQILDSDILKELAAVDLTSKTDAIEHIKAVERFEKYFVDYSCVAAAFVSPNVSLLRNINRILVKQEKAFVYGLLDGPFVSIGASIAKQSGCFECYENRLLARLEDTVVYHRFVEKTRNQHRPLGRSTPVAPIVNILTSAVLMEALLFSSLSLFKLAGRVVNVYLPMFEVQVQDLLRVPYCSACGHIAQSQMNEMHISSKHIMDRMLDRVQIRNKAK